MIYTYAYDEVVADIEAGRLDDVRFFQFGGMGNQNAVSSPVFATTSLTCEGRLTVRIEYCFSSPPVSTLSFATSQTPSGLGRI